MSTFDDIRIGFYNELSTVLGIPANAEFQMVQPATVVQQGKDAFLWNYFNLIPTADLSTNATLSPGNQFYSNYSGLLSALQGVPNNFNEHVGPQCLTDWNAYLKALTPAPDLNMLPKVFYRWAIFNGYTPVAVQGMNDLSALLLDPVNAAQLAMLMSNGPSWDQGYADLAAQLGAAPAMQFTASSGSWNAQSSHSWSSSSQSAFFGVWSTDSSTDETATMFAGSSITITGAFEHVTRFIAVPGPWYSSAAMGLAFAQQSGPPWNSSSPISWTNSFSETDGNLARFVDSLIVVSGMDVTVTSDAVFNSAQQQAVLDNSSAGLWPFYNKNQSSGSVSSASFDAQGHLAIHISSPKGTSPIVPIVIGLNVLPVSEFVGHAVQGAQLHSASLAAQQAIEGARARPVLEKA